MELHELKAFVVLADTLSFTKAADRLHIAQPGLSRKIARLEYEIGEPLFERLPTGVRLTPIGQQFHRDCIFIMHVIDEAVLRAKARASDDGA
jgi:LysR family hca operon transcriptional activator